MKSSRLRSTLSPLMSVCVLLNAVLLPVGISAVAQSDISPAEFENGAPPCPIPRIRE